MPSFIISTALAANGSATPVTGWQFEFLPWDAACRLLERATTAGVRSTVYSGSQTIKEDSPCQGGGTAGVTPSQLNTHPYEWIGAAGDRIKILYREVLGGAPTVDAILLVEPL